MSKRLDVIAKAIFDGGLKEDKVFVMKKDDGWPGYLIVFRPHPDHYLFFGKMTIDVKRKPNKNTIKKLCIKEIKSRLLDNGWYRDGLRRLIRSVHFDTITPVDAFSGQKVSISGYRFQKSAGLYNDWTGALFGYLDDYSPGVWEKYCGY